jgi:hypothetical protein
VIVGDELPVVYFQRLVVDPGRDAQDIIRIALIGTNMTRFDVAELGIGESKALSHLSKKLLFPWIKHTIRLGYVEETFKHII